MVICGIPRFAFVSDHKALESFVRVAEHNPRVRRWLEFLTAYRYTPEYRNGSANGKVDFLSRLPLPASEDDCSGHSRQTPSDEERIYPYARAASFLMALQL